MIQYLKSSTMKREVASIVMLWFIVVSTKAIWNADAVTQVQILGMLLPYVFAMFAGAFTMDWVSKQTNIAGPPTSDGSAPK